MDLSSLTRSDIDRLTKLIAERDSVIARLAEISDALGGGTWVGGGVAKSPKKAAKPQTAAKVLGKRGSLKDAIVSLLQKAPLSGISVETLSAELKRKPTALHVWFYTTGRKMKEIKKVGRGIYAWSA